MKDPIREDLPPRGGEGGNALIGEGLVELGGLGLVLDAKDLLVIFLGLVLVPLALIATAQKSVHLSLWITII